MIPIDENVNDIVDEDFLDHYLKGYYATGKLEIPEEDEEKKDESSEENKEDSTDHNQDHTNNDDANLDNG